MDVVVFLLLAAAAFGVWRFIRRAYLRAQMRHLTRAGDPLSVDLHERQMSMDWYSLEPRMRTAMAIGFQQDPNGVYATFKSGGGDLQPADFQRIMRKIIAGDPACSRIRGAAED